MRRTAELTTVEMSNLSLEWGSQCILIHSKSFVNLHIRSMWETICDAWACWSGWNFGRNSERISHILKFRIPPPPQWKLSESPNPRVSEYPPMKIVRDSKSKSFRIPPKWKLSESPNPRVSEYPPNENCQRVQIREFQNTPPKKKIIRESKSESFRIPPHKNENYQRVQIQEFQNTTPPCPPKKIGKTSDFKL